ncbi:MAG: hypothetical protein KF891_20655 [Rhizobacter sp.]|nr:hypothetical protein [Rhizobacter sp.]
MRWSLKYCVVGLLPLVLWSAAASAAPRKQTVCTITVNSADEKETFQRYLPASKYQFVELVERNRPDWLASSCRAAVSCDVLVISGHYDGGNSFFSDQLAVREYLPVTELERVSCSGSCPSLFSHLKEVYLFGCNTLNPKPQSSASAEIVQSLVREGHSPEEAKRQLQSLDAAHGESSLERMRQIFKGVPVIYGFSSTAPLGPIAAATLGRYFRSTGKGEIAQGRPSRQLLSAFSTFSMSSARGLTEGDPLTGARHDMCQFSDERLSDAHKLDFVHQLMQRPPAEARLYIDRIQRLTAGLDAATRQTPAVARALRDIAQDAPARTRFLEEARSTEPPGVRVRLINVARDLGWLSEDERWQELALMLGDLQSRRTVGIADVDLACRLNAEHDLDGAFNRRVTPGGPADDVAHAAVRACLGSSEGHLRTLQGLVSTHDDEVQFAQAYLRNRPITDTAELRRVAGSIVRMSPGDPQVRALEVLGRHYLSDRQVLDLLIDLYARTPSAAVQNAIAGILIRADRKAIARPELAQTLTAHRRPARSGGGLLDALIASLSTTPGDALAPSRMP